MGRASLSLVPEPRRGSKEVLAAPLLVAGFLALRILLLIPPSICPACSVPTTE